MQIIISPDSIAGLPLEEKERFSKLLDVHNKHATKNAEKERYYEGKISLGEVNLGIALPDGMQKLEIGCAWGAKAVDVLAARSMFDGFVGESGSEVEALTEIMVNNNFIAEYQKACRDELKYAWSCALHDDRWPAFW